MVIQTVVFRSALRVATAALGPLVERFYRILGISRRAVTHSANPEERPNATVDELFASCAAAVSAHGRATQTGETKEVPAAE